MSQPRLEIELKVGIFVAIGLALIMLAILLLGSTDNILSKKTHFTIHLNNAEGLVSGAKVVVGGIPVGTIEKLGFDDQTHDIQVLLNVTTDTAKYIKQDSEAEIATQGVLGDHFITITPGTEDSPPLAAGSEIPLLPTKGISQFLGQSDQLIVRLNSVATSLDRLLKEFESGNRSEKFFQGMSTTAHNLASATEKLDKQMDDLKLKKIMKNVEAITEKINNGNGTLGALINDPSLYDNVKTLVGQANRNRILRNLVRQTIRDSESSQPTEAADQAQKK